jgi:hypothetical protein
MFVNKETYNYLSNSHKLCSIMLGAPLQAACIRLVLSPPASISRIAVSVHSVCQKDRLF